MGAIAGLWCTDGRPAGAPLEPMLAALRPYGPEATGRWAHDDVALGHLAMHLHPEDVADRQPLIGGGGRFVMVADARLDNREELAETLALPTPPATDAEWVLRAFERWGEDCLHRLYGDYAFAVWDREHQRWLLARDGLGGRPLCYFRGRRLFAFASMPRGVHALPEVPYEPDEDLLARALDFVPPDPHATCFRQINRVGMGECVTVTRDGETRRRHWDPRPEPLRLRRPADYEEALRAEFDRAVRVRLPGTGGVAAQLSSGLDSSAVTATAARLLAARGDGITAFTAVPGDGDAIVAPPGKLPDEGPLAATTAALYSNMEHVRVPTGRRSPLDALGWCFELYEQPALNLCNQVWRDDIYELAQGRGLTVLLTGQAGNLTLSYKANRPLAERLRNRGMAGVMSELGSVVARRLGGLFRTASTPPTVGQGELFTSFINPQRSAELGPPDHTLLTWQAPDSRAERLAALHRVDLAAYAKGALARWRIDERDPTADRRFVEFCLSVPDEQFRLGGIPASLARRALADRLPQPLLQSRKRGLQAANWHAGFSDPQRELGKEIARLAACRETARMLDLDAMRQAIEHWPSGGWHDAGVDFLYRIGLLRALSNGDFLRRAIATSQASGAASISDY